MSTLLQPGANISIDSFSGTVIISHEINHTLDINLTAFLLTDSGKVLDDNGVVFFNNPKDIFGIATFISPENTGSIKNHKINFDLSRATTGIKKIAIALTDDRHGVGFSAAKNLKAEVHTEGDVITLIPNTLTTEKGIIVLELYVRNNHAKVKSVWQGFSSGLGGLCRHFGVDVSDDRNSSPAAPPVLQATSIVKKAPVTLTKDNQSHKVSLIKGDSAPKKIIVSATWVDNGDGRDNDDLDLRVGILLPDGRMKIIQAPDKSGSFNADPFVVHTGDVTSASASAPGVETVEVNPDISVRLGGKVALVLSVYSAISNGVVSIASLKPKMRMEYGDQVVECATEFKKGFGSSMVYTYVIGLIEIDQNDIILRPSGETSKMMSEATPWLEWDRLSPKLTMDGPPVFKGKPIATTGKKHYS